MYTVVVTPRGLRALRSIDRTTGDRITQRIKALAHDPRPHGSQKLAGRSEYRIRVADYRIVYEIIDSSKQVNVLGIGHRREVYR